MKIAVELDDELVRVAQEMTGIEDLSELLNFALKHEWKRIAILKHSEGAERLTPERFSPFDPAD